MRSETSRMCRVGLEGKEECESWREKGGGEKKDREMRMVIT